MRLSLRLVIPVLILILATPMLAATRTWTGATNTLWSNAGNWDTGVPVGGDDLVFPAAALNPANQNDLAAGTSFGTITLGGGYTITGNALTLTAALLNATGVNTFHPPITLAANVTIQAPTTTQLHLFSTVALGANELTFLADGTGRIDANGVISGTGSVRRTRTAPDGDSGYLFLAGANNYTGVTNLSGGYTYLAHPTALGSPVAGTVINPAATLVVNGIAFLNEPITSDSTGNNNNGTFQTTGTSSMESPITLLSHAAVYADTLRSLDFRGAITGTGGMEARGNGVTMFSNPGNAWSGGLQYSAGGTTIVRLGAVEVLPNDTLVTFDAGDTLDLNNFAETIAGLVGAGNVTLGSGTLTLTGLTTHSGVISGTGAVAISGSVTFDGANTYTGPTLLTAGEFILNGSIVSPATVAGGVFRLFDGSSAGAITSSGGNVTFVGGVYTGDLDFGAGSSTTFSATSTAPGQHSVAAAGGTVTLASTLYWVPLAAFPDGTEFMIIGNDAADPTNGTFNGLPEGASFAAGSNLWTITYVGGDGNDVVLTASALPLTATTTTVTSDLNPSTYGDSVTFTATVTGAGGTPTGTVSFYSDGALIGNNTLDGSGQTILIISGLDVGTHAITAMYSGDATYATSTSAPLDQVVNAAAAPVAGVPALDGIGLFALLAALAFVGLRMMRS